MRQLKRSRPSISISVVVVMLCLVAYSSGTSEAAEPGSDSANTRTVEIAAAEQVYVRQLKPLFRQRCYACHGALKQESGLRLDTVSFMKTGGDSGPAIPSDLAQGSPAESLLLERVSATDIYLRMPPEHEGEAFSAAQLDLLHRWLAAGAPGPAEEQPEADPSEHWAFQARVRPEIPQVDGEMTWRNPIDAFLATAHAEQGLVPTKEASRNVLVRRLYLDLIGLPPTLDEWEQLAADASLTWYEDLANRLLDDPRYGERWARHWMDVWRYSDWWGLGNQLRNSQHHIWHWRDWIVESLNGDAPYDEMIRQMLAADELYPNDLDKLRASGYLARNYFLFNRNQWMEETVEHVGKGFLGLTMNCAKCHDHKYDPISQVDYYRMRAIFEPYHVRLDVRAGEPDLLRDGIPRAFDAILETPTYLFVRGQESQPDKSTEIEPGVPTFLAPQAGIAFKPVELPKEAWQPERRPWVVQGELAASEARIAQAKIALDLARIAFEEREQRLATLPADQDVKPLSADTSVAKAASGEIGITSPAKMPPPHPEQEDSAIPPATESAEQTLHTELKLAQAKLAVQVRTLDQALAERDSIERRAVAMRARWKFDEAVDEAVSPEQQSKLEATAKKAASDAARSEREFELAITRTRLDELEWRHLEAKPDKQEALQKELIISREALAEAERKLDDPGEQFTHFTGAAWTPTRFLYSTRDDPTLEFPSFSTGRRTALAEWITDDGNPLTARVAVNQLWMRHMGAPLVPSVFDFGRGGIPPTHPKLLDWLASELVDSGWSMKHLHRLIVTSAAYRRSSSLLHAEENIVKDPDNQHWWRRMPIRLESQVIRDTILALAGQLDTTMGGPSVPPAEQPASTRRSLYFFHSNNDRNLFLTMFDDALVKECYRREQSIVPQQALALSNSQLVHDASRKIVERLSGMDREALSRDLTDDQFVRRAFAFILGISIREAELRASLGTLRHWRAQQEADPDEEVLDAARVYLVWALLNHNDFVTLR